MTFVPKSGKHAIAEVVFGLVLDKAFEPNQIETLVKNHYRWKEHLPRVSRGGGVQLMFGSGFPPPQIQMPMEASVSFERVNPDGTLNWRLKIEQNTIFVNCLDYTRWTEIWGTAREYLKLVVSLTETEAKLTSALLQYIDVFEWNQSVDTFDIHELLRVGNEYIPASMGARGHLFHLHQGWYSSIETARRLVRVHVDGVEEFEFVGDPNNPHRVSPIVKIDTYLQDQLNEPVPTINAFDSGWIDSSFSDMHDENKNLLRAFLTDELCGRIGLNV
ncbi:TIGR04255 family protein [Agrobacterium sp. InxBP2]|uniref:TIGR04255 family protein n=1 Tax=Agrobacterium sp. InxBP2 TaxID=2870329 RepID=UPI00249EF38E|nr:TIGR04255 family protein [Agrobacterium sp. InxBP2]MCW8283963.1 TIGR04255 family protein [Agrobacterium sp. InxBP2]